MDALQAFWHVFHLFLPALALGNVFAIIIAGVVLLCLRAVNWVDSELADIASDVAETGELSIRRRAGST